MKIRFFFLFLSILSCAHNRRFDQPHSDRSPARTGSYFDSLRDELKAQVQPTTVGAFLAMLKKKPEFAAHFSNYTLVHESLSLQSGTPLAPRALLFGEDGRFVFSFNSQKSSRGAYAIESVEYDPDAKSLSYREVVFKDELSGPLKSIAEQGLSQTSEKLLDQEFGLRKSEIEFENERFAITKANPQKCLQCHQVSSKYETEARYIWDGYADWPGVYGQDDDVLEVDSEDPKKYAKTLKAFKQLAKGEARYRHLDLGKDEEFPFVKVGSFVYPRRPNLRMTKLFGAYQSEVFVQLLSRDLSAQERKDWAVRILCQDKAEEFIQQVLHDVPISLSAFEREGFYKGKFFLGSPGIFMGKETEFRQDFKYMIANVWVLNELLRERSTQALAKSLLVTNASEGEKLSDFKVSSPAFKRTIARYYGLGLGTEVVLNEIRAKFCP